jgi:methylenetetrahydrofolate dehydrogenase (NADP+)/methenyltetrahydrofolate cyclohydrolase
MSVGPTPPSSLSIPSSRCLNDVVRDLPSSAVLTNLIDGRAIAEQVYSETTQRIAALQARGVQPGLAFVRVGDDPASQVYVRMKERTCRNLGFHSETRVLPQATPAEELLSLIEQLNADPRLHGILVQAPLPAPLNPAVIYAAVAPQKDVDGFHPVNVGKLMLGDRSGFVPCTPAGIQQLLVRAGVPTEGSEVVILGRGDIVGKPMAALLCQKAPGANATVTLVHSRTRDVAAHCRRADILIAAMGVAGFVRGPMVKPGAVVIDVGVNRVPDPGAKDGTRLVGDVDFSGVQPIAGKITPNPGGVGPMTIAMLMQNTVRAAEMAAGLSHRG